MIEFKQLTGVDSNGVNVATEIDIVVRAESGLRVELGVAKRCPGAPFVKLYDVAVSESEMKQIEKALRARECEQTHDESSEQG